LKRVIFDSSFLMAVVENPTTWFEDMVDALGKFEPVLPDCVRRELQELVAEGGRRSRVARVCLEVASEFADLHCGEAQVDDEIVSAALATHAAIATTDSSLARSARGVHLKVASLRKGRVSVE
jgi:rRNA-processing protein FCF1